MRPLISYNCTLQALRPGEDIAGLYETRKRNAAFALVYEQDGTFTALRDHLGVVPLFYRREGTTWRFSTSLRELTRPADTLDKLGLRVYLVTGTAKIHPLFAEIGVVPPGTALRFTGEDITPIYHYRWQPQPFDGPAEAGAAHYFQQAMARLRPQAGAEAAIFLSGGIDSALIGLDLKAAGAKVHAYTAGPWGESSSDLPYARTNADRAGAASHTVYPLAPKDYPERLAQIPTAYPTPHGTRAAINILPLWDHIRAAHDDHTSVFFGQNLDTLACSMRSQSVAYFGGQLPRPLRERAYLYGPNPLSQYISYRSRGLLRGADLQQTPLGGFPWGRYNRLQQITLLGMLFTHTPADSDVIGQLAVASNVPLANPYYDVDLIEFYLGVSVWHRLQLTRRKPFIKLEKHLHRALARQQLPAELVQRTKALTVPFEHHPHTAALAASFPSEMGGVRLDDLDQRFAAECLRRWGDGLVDIPAGLIKH